MDLSEICKSDFTTPLLNMHSANHHLWYDSFRFTDVLWRYVNLYKLGTINSSVQEHSPPKSF